MDDWEKFNETTLPEKEEFYSNLSLEGITSVDYTHGKRVCKDLEMKHLGEIMICILKFIHYFWLMFLKPCELARQATLKNI